MGDLANTENTCFNFFLSFKYFWFSWYFMHFDNIASILSSQSVKQNDDLPVWSKILNWTIKGLNGLVVLQIFTFTLHLNLRSRCFLTFFLSLINRSTNYPHKETTKQQTMRQTRETWNCCWELIEIEYCEEIRSNVIDTFIRRCLISERMSM